MKKTKGKSNQKWVVKAGSQIIQDGGPMLIRDWMRQVAFLRKQGVDVIWVTSGAITSAKQLSKSMKSFRLHSDLTIPEKQSLSAIGQPLIMNLYNQALMESGLMGAQILICTDDLKNKTRRANFVHSLNQLLKWGMVPVLNENDAVATEEIRFGDNDSLSAHVSEVIQADRLILLTNVDGVLDQDPRLNAKAKRVREIPRVSAQLKTQLNTASKSKSGTGGMYSKVLAAEKMLKLGKEAWIVGGETVRVLEKIYCNDDVGTRFVKPGRDR